VEQSDIAVALIVSECRRMGLEKDETHKDNTQNDWKNEVNV